MTKKLPKINNAAFRVLKTFKFLFEEDLTMNELIDKLNNSLDEQDKSEYNNFVVSKYINTCKCCGIDIQKIDGKYAIVNSPFGEKFTEGEAQLVYELINNKENKKLKKLSDDLLTKLHLPAYKSSNGLKSSESCRIIKLFEKALTGSSQTELILRNGEVIKCLPKEIKAQKGKIILHVETDGGIKEVCADDLADINLSDKSVRKLKNEPKDVIFELRGKLAKRYQLRENEQIIRFKNNGSIVVSNKYEDKEELLRRLMRYDYLCKIVRPASYVEEIKKMINNTLSNYGE